MYSTIAADNERKPFPTEAYFSKKECRTEIELWGLQDI